MTPIPLADLGPTTDPADSVPYGAGFGVIELTRLARIREKELAQRDAAWHEERSAHLHYKEIAELYGQQRDDLTTKLAQRDAEIRELRAAIEADRTRIIDGVNALDRALNGRFWLTEGRGSYEWNDDRYRKEFGDAARAVLKAVEPLRKIGADLANCPPTTDEVIAARRNKDARIAELERDGTRLKSALSQIEALTVGGKGQSAVNMIAQLALNSDVPMDDLEYQASQDVIIRETLLEVLSHAVDGVVSVEAIRAMEAAIGDLPAESAALSSAPKPHPDTRRLDHLQKLIDDAKSDGNNLTIFPRKGDDRQTIREYLDDAMKEAEPK